MIQAFDWSDRLQTAELLTDSEWLIGPGLSSGDGALNGDSATFDNFTTEIRITDGTLNETYVVTNIVTTSAAITYEKSFKVLVVAR